MSKDSTHTYLHLHRARDADLFEDFCSHAAKLPADDIYVPPAHQPLNPEDEDDVVPDQHAAFGIQRATQKVHEKAWKDLGLAELMLKGPGAGEWERRSCSIGVEGWGTHAAEVMVSCELGRFADRNEAFERSGSWTGSLWVLGTAF